MILELMLPSVQNLIVRISADNFISLGTISSFQCDRIVYSPGEGTLPIMAYTGRLRPKGVAFLGFRYMKG